MTDERMPVYVQIKDYNNVLHQIQTLRSKAADAQRLLDEISRLKSQEDAEIESWKLTINELQNKINTFDTLLLQPDK